MKFFSSKPKKVKKKSRVVKESIELPIVQLNFQKTKLRLHGRIEKDGAVIYYKDGILHNANEPAIVWEDGSYQWYYNGALHRENGPAIESQGSKYWYSQGKRHRIDGPAVEFSNGKKEWWIDGEELTESLFLAYLEEKNKKSF